jgi:hypothetical protein
VRCCLSRAPSDRFASAQELAAALHEAAPEPTHATAGSRRGVWLVALAVVALVAVAAAVLLRG